MYEEITAQARQAVTELLEQAKQCESEDEVITMLQNSGVEIPDEVLDGVAGGYWGGGGGGCDCNWYHF